MFLNCYGGFLERNSLDLFKLNATRATEMEPPLTFDQAMVEAGMVLSRNGEQERPPADGSMTSRNVENRLKSLSKEVSFSI